MSTRRQFCAKYASSRSLSRMSPRPAKPQEKNTRATVTTAVLPWPPKKDKNGRQNATQPDKKGRDRQSEKRVSSGGVRTAKRDSERDGGLRRPRDTRERRAGIYGKKPTKEAADVEESAEHSF